MPSTQSDVVTQPNCVPEDQPVFLVGAERSGTTMLRLMLDHHPSVSFYPEFEFCVERLGDDGSLPPLEAYHAWLQQRRDFQHYGLRIEPSLPYEELMRSFLREKRAREATPLVGATVHKWFHRLPHLWPEARYIHLIRDGRDVARSAVGMGWAGNVYQGVERWIHAQETWKRLKPMLREDQYIEIYYEDLLRDVEGTLERICNFIGLPFTHEMLSYSENSTYDPPDPTLTYQWRRKLSSREVQLVESKIAGELSELGYPPSGLGEVNVSRIADLLLRIHSWVGQLRFRVRRFGLALYALDVAARKLHITPLENYTRPRVQAINRRHIK